MTRPPAPGVVELSLREESAEQSSDSGDRCIEVAVPVPLFKTFAYRVPHEMAWPVSAGARVLVPFGSRRVIGICVGATSRPGGVQLKNVAAVVDSEPSLPRSLLRTARWISEWYAAPIGLTLRSMLPALLLKSQSPVPRPRTLHVVRLINELPSLLARERMFSRAPKQRLAFNILEELGGEAPMRALMERAQCTKATIAAMADRGVVEIVDEASHHDPFASREGVAPPPAPSAAQSDAVRTILAGDPGSVFLLHGVTGSGKTLVYIEVLRAILAQPGKTAIVLVPEIALTPQTVDRFRGAFGDDVAVLHSGLNDRERLEAWQGLRRGDRRIAVGARSALFAPLEGVGVIIVDEEHEGSYKQAETPRYHAREAAMVRARHEGAITVLGSATPSLESWSRAKLGRVARITLPERAGGAALPSVRVIDMKATGEGHGYGSSGTVARDSSFGVLSRELIDAIQQRCDRREQTLLMLNRRGYSAFMQCNSCGYVPACPHCSISLTYHRTTESFVCHYCQYQTPATMQCPQCHSTRLSRRGSGTQQVERLVAERFPGARIARMDIDTTAGKWSHSRILDRVARGEVDILLGTQMIAKGLDFPNVTLVGVVDADIALNLPDFRAAERTFQLLSQVAGRAGRGPKGGEVIIQTRLPGAAAITFAVNHDYSGFVNAELRTRESPSYPPAVSLANVVISGSEHELVADAAIKASTWLRESLSRSGRIENGGIGVVGPAPCPIEKIKDRWRWHFLMKSSDAREMTRLVRFVAERCPIGQRDGGAGGSLKLIVDRDPVSLL